jgi:nucleoid DNA-binding protein
MTQDEFYRKIADKSDITLSGVEEVMGAFVETFQECVSERQSFIIQNIGVLEFSKVKARTIKGNPNFLDGQDKEYPETERVFFHLSNNLKSLFRNSKK